MVKENSANKYRYLIIIFVVNAAAMILELAASRIMSPYFGNYNSVWTAIIGIILLSGAAGNYVGGRLADRCNLEFLITATLFGAAVFAVIIPLLGDTVFLVLRVYVPDIRVGAVIAACAEFFLPSMMIGMLTPAIMKLCTDRGDSFGSSAGKYYAIVTAGGIAGTFAGGFFLIPSLGSLRILYITSAILAAMALYSVSRKSDKIYAGLSCVVFVVSVFGLYGVNRADARSEIDFDNNTEINIDIDTQYGTVRVYNYELNGDMIRIYRQSGAYSSATYLDEAKKYELVFDYAKFYNNVFYAGVPDDNVLMIGGAAYMYPKYFISHTDGSMDVIEIDAGATDIAKRYFFLDDLIEEYETEKNGRLNLITDDGRIFVEKTDKRYNAVLNDAFSGVYPPVTLSTLEMCALVKDVLKDDGVYALNILGSMSGPKSQFLKAEVKTLQQVFEYVVVVPCIKDDAIVSLEGDDFENFMVYCSDSPLDVGEGVALDLSDAIILTDDYAPVEAMADAWANTKGD